MFARLGSRSRASAVNNGTADDALANALLRTSADDIHAACAGTRTDGAIPVAQRAAIGPAVSFQVPCRRP